MGRLNEIHASGASLAFVGNGRPDMARHFAEKEVPGATVLTDPSLDTYRALGMRRGVAETLSLRSSVSAVGALLRGNMQTRTQGDPWQQGGLMVLDRQGRILFLQRNRDAGDRPDLDAALKTLRPGTRAA